MKKFSIDLKASDKGERKKALKYLKSKGLEFCDNDRWKPYKRWNYIYKGDIGFCYSSIVTDVDILTLPRDWYKLVEIVEGENKAKVAFDSMFDSIKSDLETFLEI